MFRKEIGRKIRWICLDCVHLRNYGTGHGVTGRVGIVYGNAKIRCRPNAGRRMVLHIAFHGDSSRWVACLNDARLEQTLECRRRDREYKLLLQAYASRGSRACDFRFVRADPAAKPFGLAAPGAPCLDSETWEAELDSSSRLSCPARPPLVE